MTKRQNKQRRAKRANPEPWWSPGKSPSARWPGVTIDVPAVWSTKNARWESPDGRYYFDSEAASFAEDFFPTFLEHHLGEWNGRPFELMDYQRLLVVRPLFGWKRKDGLRRFRKVFLAVPKGSGKSPLCAGLGLLLAFFDHEAGAEVYAVAADRKQAGIVFDSAKIMVQRNELLDARCEVLRDSIKLKGSTEYFQVLSSDASTKHGFRPHGIVFDEFHAQPNRALFDALMHGMGKRRQPVLIMITTAGDDDESICMEEWDYARSIVSHPKRDESYLPVIFEAKSEEDWTSVAVLKRVNPGYGVTMKAEYFATECAAAQAEPRKRNSYLQLHLNRWVNQATAWIPVEWWDACQEPLPSDDVLRECPCAFGIDMAQKIDLAAGVALFRLPLEAGSKVEEIEIVAEGDAGEVIKKRAPLDYRIAVLPAFWLPEETLKERVHQDRVPYDQWATAGLLTVVEGAILTSEPIVRYLTGRGGQGGLLERFPHLKEAEFGYDPAFATEVAVRLRDDHELRVIEVLQNYKHLTEACQVFEALVKAKRVLHGGHRLLRWNLENVAIKHDDAGRIRPVKPKKAAKRIDGIVATIMALSRLMVLAEDEETEASRDFETRGIWVQ